MRRMPIPARPVGLSSPGDAPGGCTRYQPPFRRVVPLAGAGCIRVTHPCAGRRRDAQARPPLPLDLHVLSLPLAFILSQDQTLRCFMFPSCDESLELSVPAFRCCLGPPQNQPPERDGAEAPLLPLSCGIAVNVLGHPGEPRPPSQAGPVPVLRVQSYDLSTTWQNVFAIFFTAFLSILPQITINHRFNQVLNYV